MKPYRIEERDRITGNVLKFTDQGWDGPLLTADEAQDRFDRELRLHPTRYEVDSPFRLVLVAPVTEPTRCPGVPHRHHRHPDAPCPRDVAAAVGNANNAGGDPTIGTEQTQRPAILNLPRVHPADDPTLTPNQRAAGRILAATGRKLRTLVDIDADNRAARAVIR